MRRALQSWMIAAIVALVPTLALAGNQEIAEQIKKNIKTSGRLSGYSITVKVQDGTAWLGGRVRSEEQMVSALNLALGTDGVERVVNNLNVGTSSEAAAAEAKSGSRSSGQARFSVQPASADEPLPMVQGPARTVSRGSQRPLPVAYTQPVGNGGGVPGAPMPMYTAAASQAGVAPARYDQPCLPNYAWPSYAAYPNYAAVTYPKQYSPTAWPYIGPFYPYPQVPLGWRKVSLEWKDGWWWLDFKDRPSCWESPVGRWY